MHIAILNSNTDRSAFAQRHDSDVVKFSRLLFGRRPDWEYSGFNVVEDEFPESYSAFDGVLVTGSPASANDPFAWIARLKDDIRALVKEGKPLFGACFGHQVIAVALGGEVGHNDFGWAAGYVETRPVNDLPWQSGQPATLGLYACHKEQVLKAPDGAEIVLEADGVPVGGYVLGGTVFALQYHPEMDDFFMKDLMNEYAPDFGPETAAKAKASLARRAEREHISETIALFFESAADG